MYTVADYDAMLADAVRTQAYLGAIARAVRPGDVVVEIGTGVGYFAVAAARAGARHVYAIEQNPAVALGPAVAAANDCADRITFLQGHSMRVTLPEKGDVLLEDLRGVLPLAGDHIPSVIDARTRHLRVGATIVPVRDTLWAAPSEADAAFRARHVTPGDAPYGIDRRAVDAVARQNWYRADLKREELFAPAAQWGAIEFATVTTPQVSGGAEWTIERAGCVEGICIWFDTDLGFGCGYSNAPGLTATLHGRGFLPFTRAVDALPGDRVHTEIRASLVEGEYVLAWDTVFEPLPGSGRRGAQFRQSTIAATPMTLELLRRRRDDHRPSRGAAAALFLELLSLSDGSHTLREIADALACSHSGRFPDVTAALRYATGRLAALEDEDAAGKPLR
ncbi:MAG: 50S ribosomal protein L11 methyltransferase [Gemmatimonadales bacterium]|jgi:protein arginine N-methyltransferase 1